MTWRMMYGPCRRRSLHLARPAGLRRADRASALAPADHPDRGRPHPRLNPAYFHSGFRNGPLRVPPDLVDRFADLIETHGVRGKFSVIPCPFGLGRVDRDVEGVAAADLR